MASTSFSFYELPVTIGGIDWLLTGEDIALFYEVQPAEPDVGIFEAFAEDAGIEDDTIELTGFYRAHSGEWTDEQTLTLSRGMFAFAQVESAADTKMDQAANDAANDEPYDDYFDCRD